MNDSPVCIYQAADASEAQLVKDLLQAEGIDARVVGENQPYAGLLAATTVDVLIAQADQAQAEQVVRAYDEQKVAQANQPTWKCVRCGASVPGSFDACFECGTDQAGNQPSDEDNDLPQPTTPATSGLARETSITNSAAFTSQPPVETLSSTARRQIWIEVGVVFSILATIYYVAIAALVWPDVSGEIPWDFNTAWWQIVRDMQSICVVLFVMWRSGQSWTKFGVMRPQFSLDLPVGLGIFLVDFACILLIASLWPWAESAVDGELPAKPSGLLTMMIVLSLCLGAFCEELMMRGFLQTRFEQLFNSRVKSVLLVTLLFAGYHMYLGAWGVVSAATAGIVYGTSFSLLRRIWPVTLAHTVYNLHAQFSG